MENDLKIIKDGIQAGIEKGYFQRIAYENSDNVLQDDIIEYIFTMNVAREVLERIINNKLGHTVHIEYSSNSFINNAFQIYSATGGPDNYDSNIRKNHKPFGSESGRIDISVMKHPPLAYSQLRSFVGIELKAINPNDKKLLDDYDRLAHAMIETDPAGANNIERCYVAFAKRLDTPKQLFQKEDFVSSLEIYLKELNNLIEYNSTIKGIEFSVDHFVIINQPSSEYAKSIPEEWWDENNIRSNSGSVIGIIITLIRK